LQYLQTISQTNAVVPQYDETLFQPWEMILQVNKIILLYCEMPPTPWDGSFNLKKRFPNLGKPFRNITK
jgi:hypothetical protein